MKKIIFLFLIIFLKFNSVHCQNCPNADFTYLNFDNWQGFIGNNTVLSWCCPIPGIVHGRHTLITQAMTDPYTGGALSVPPPGYSVCARLGDPTTSCEAEQLVYEFTVDSANPIFFYTFAVVLQDPHYVMPMQPHFTVRIMDSTHTWIDTVCGLYQAYSDSAAPGFQTYTVGFNKKVNWRDWSTGTINLAGLVGNRLRIIFTTYDAYCTAFVDTSVPQFGYAYITARCGSLALDQTICQGSNNLNLTAPPDFSYLWSTGDTTQTITIPNPLFGTSYQCQLHGVTGCNFTLSTTIGLNMFTVVYPGFTFSHDSCSKSFAFNNTTVVNTGSRFSSFWDFGDGTTSKITNPRHTFPASGQYTVSLSITTLGGCDTTITQLIDISHLPQAIFSANDTCQPNGIPIYNFSTAQDSIISWAWDFGDGTIQDTINWNPTHYYANPGTDTIRFWLTDANGCTDSVSHILTVYPSILAKFSRPQQICEGTTSKIFFIGNALQNTTFTWDFDSALVLSGSGPGPYVVQWPDSGLYIVTLELSGPSCHTVYTDTLHVNPSPSSTFTVEPLSNCLEDTLQIQYTGDASPSANYYWNFNGAIILSGSGQGPYTIKWPAVGTYTITLLVDEHYCISSESIFKVNVEKVEASIISSQDALCYHSSDGSAMATASGGTPPYSYSWSNNSTNALMDSVMAGIYIVTVSDSSGCTGTDTINISSPLAFSINSGLVNPNCEYSCNGAINVVLSGAVSPYTYLWNTTIPQTTSSISDLCPGTYILTVSDDHLCDTVVQFPLAFSTNILASAYSNIITGPVPLSVNFEFTGYGANSLVWDFGDSTYSNLLNPSHTFTSVGNHQIILVVNSQAPDYCSDTTVLFIYVEDTSYLEVPNVFTPNNDGINDYFTIKSHYLENCTVTIFNRWGTVIYKTNGEDISWDGKTEDGNPAPEGTYFFKLGASGKDGRLFKSQGALTLLR